MAPKLKLLWPAIVAALAAASFVGVRLYDSGWDPVALAEVGGRYSELDPDGEEGYDGQFVYFMALDLSPASVAERLDVPAYRYQRILYPLLARALAFGRVEWVPWSLLAVNLAAHALGTFAVAALLAREGRWSGYSLTYGLWVGLVAPAGLDLHEPLAFGLLAWGMLAWFSKRKAVGAGLICLSLFAKETLLPFWLAFTWADLRKGQRSPQTLLLLGGGAAFVLWQLWLRRTFGQFGIASGGAMASSFEWIPYMGLWRIGFVEPRALLLFLVIFGPAIVLPSLWSVIVSLQGLWRGNKEPLRSAALFLNSALLVFLPFSTFREPLGLVRIATGMVLALLVFAAHHNITRALNYSLFWIALLALIVRS